jgi:hypothetical protein
MNRDPAFFDADACHLVCSALVRRWPRIPLAGGHAAARLEIEGVPGFGGSPPVASLRGRFSNIGIADANAERDYDDIHPE